MSISPPKRLAPSDRSRPSQGVLLSNEGGSHASVLRGLLAGASRLTCVVAFARMSGFEMISEALATRVAGGMRATFVIGLDFYQTEPELLSALLRLKGRGRPGRVRVLMGAEGHSHTMHPKVYAFSHRDGTTSAVIGSANMTRGGFRDNHEFSAVMRGQDVGWMRELDDWIKAQVGAGEIVEADAEAIGRYAARRTAYLPHVQIAERRARAAAKAGPGQTSTLRAILAAMRADDGVDGFDAQAARRAASHVEAAALLGRLARRKGSDERGFLLLYEPLVAGLWHSGGLQRAKTTIARRAREFQDALRWLDGSPSEDPEVLFERLRTLMAEVPKAGVNVITEILHTRDRTRFAVMNQNSVAGMRRAQLAGYPGNPSKRSVDGASYARFCSDAAKVARDLGLGDLGELDALFNYAYWG